MVEEPLSLVQEFATMLTLKWGA